MLGTYDALQMLDARVTSSVPVTNSTSTSPVANAVSTTRFHDTDGVNICACK